MYYVPLKGQWEGCRERCGFCVWTVKLEWGGKGSSGIFIYSCEDEQVDLGNVFFFHLETDRKRCKVRIGEPVALLYAKICQVKVGTWYKLPTDAEG